MSLIWLLARSRNWIEVRSLIGPRLVMAFLARFRDARLRHFSRPVRSLIPIPMPLTVERFWTSDSVIGLSLSRFSKTNLRTAASSFLSRKIETSGGFSVLLVLVDSAAKAMEELNKRKITHRFITF